MKTLPIAGLLAGLLAALTFLPALAQQQPYTVTVTAPPTAQPGSPAAITIRIEGQVAILPSFTYDVEGATLLGVLAPTPVAANVAEGTVFVRRDTPGSGALIVSFAGQVLARATVQFGTATGTIRVETLLAAGPEAAARTWRYQALDPAGTVVAELQISTSGDAPLGAASATLPAGVYAIRQILGSDTALACATGIFYAVSQPVGAVSTVSIAPGGQATVRYTIAPCPDLPRDPEILIPVDTIAPGPEGGIVGEPAIAPSEPPFNQVAGARQPGPGLLPPAAGNSAPQPVTQPLPALLAAASLLLLSGSGMLLLSRRRSRPLP
ncbi:hypothetical protein [Tepidiforma sp.]|uniref:hypothetical protein n=1 Tax=Tepidiforma sp. TaxID=2682230 RepID=UPI002ADD5883|nr:hypothetical protein [Tepidiforma sp.]